MAPLQRGRPHAYFTYACGGGLAAQLRRPLTVQSSCAAGKSLRQKSGDFCHLPFQGRQECWLGYGFTAYILTCLKTRKKDLRTFGKPLVVRYERAGLMAPLQRGRPHAYFTYAMWRGIGRAAATADCSPVYLCCGKIPPTKIWRFLSPPFSREARVRPAFLQQTITHVRRTKCAACQIFRGMRPLRAFRII